MTEKKETRIRVDVWASNKERLENEAKNRGLTPQETANVILAEWFAQTSKYDVLIQKLLNELSNGKSNGKSKTVITETEPESKAEKPTSFFDDF